MLKRLRFRFEPEGYWLPDISRDYPDVTFVISLNYIVDGTVHTDLVVHTGDGELLDAVEQDCRDHPQVDEIKRVYDGPRGSRYHVAYDATSSFYPTIVRHTPVAIGAVPIQEGTERYEIIGEPEDLGSILDLMRGEGDLEVEGIEQMRSGSAGDGDGLPLGVELTDKQVDALSWAHSDGYFRWPRERSASDLADEVDMSLSAFLDRLRQAEAKVLDAFMDMFRDRDPARYSVALKQLREAERDRPTSKR